METVGAARFEIRGWFLLWEVVFVTASTAAITDLDPWVSKHKLQNTCQFKYWTVCVMICFRFIFRLLDGVKLWVFKRKENWPKIFWLYLRSIAIQFCTDNHGPKSMNHFPSVPPWGWHLCFRVKCLNNYRMDCHELWCRYSFSPEDEL